MANKDCQFTITVSSGPFGGYSFSQVSFHIWDSHSVSSVIIEELCANKAAITCLVAADVN